MVPELWQKSLTRLHDHFIKYHKHRRQYKDNHDHTDDRTSRHQDTQGTDHINIGIHADTEGRCKEAERAYNDRLDGAAKRRRNRFLLVRSVVAKLLVLCCHENRIIDRRAELNRTDDNRSDKRQRRVRICRNTHVDKNGELNDRHQNDRQ